jgi:hypothetical protein
MGMESNYREDLEQLFEQAFDSALSETDRSVLLQIRAGTDNLTLPTTLVEDEEDSEEEIDPNNIYALVQNMSIPEKIKLAMLGNKSARSLLIRDSHRTIPFFVLQNPKITESEIQEIAKNTNIDDGILRAIGTDNQWMRTYAMKVSLVSNPKAPVDVTVKWLRYLRDRDLRRLARSKNIPQVVASQCARLVALKEKKGG